MFSSHGTGSSSVVLEENCRLIVLMPHLCWTNYFLECQGYNVHSTIMYQDNQSEILLENNGRSSSSKRTKHLNIRYFLSPTKSKRVTFILSIVPPTIWSRIFTKPLQGKKFLQFRKLIMNLQD